MKTKKVLALAVVMFLVTLSQRIYAQELGLWFEKDRVAFFTSFVPENGSRNAYYNLKVVNQSTETKSIYYYPVYVYNDEITGTFEKRYFNLKPGESYKEKFYITLQAKIQAGNHMPSVTFKEYYVKKY